MPAYISCSTTFSPSSLSLRPDKASGYNQTANKIVHSTKMTPTQKTPQLSQQGTSQTFLSYLGPSSHSTQHTALIRKHSQPLQPTSHRNAKAASPLLLLRMVAAARTTSRARRTPAVDTTRDHGVQSSSLGWTFAG